jgi:rare lipoprotein A
VKRALLLALCAATAASAAPKVVTVRAGDTLWAVSREHGVSVADLRRWNALPGDDLRVGQTLRLGVDDAAAPSPAAAPAEVFQRGMAVYYVGKPDAGSAMTAAHLTLPFGTLVRVTHARTHRSVVVRVNDRGPFGRPERVIDLSTDAARALGIIDEGVAPVTLEVLQRP